MKWRGNREEDTMAKNIAALNRFGIYKLSIYKNSWKKTDKKFF